MRNTETRASADARLPKLMANSVSTTSVNFRVAADAGVRTTSTAPKIVGKRYGSNARDGRGRDAFITDLGRYEPAEFYLDNVGSRSFVKGSMGMNRTRGGDTTIDSLSGANGTAATLSTLGIRMSEDEIRRRLTRRFIESVNVNVRGFVEGKREFLRIFDDYDLICVGFEEVIERVKCYRVELGGIMESLVTSTRGVIERCLEITIKLVRESEARHERHLKEYVSSIEGLQLSKAEMDEKNRNLINLLNLQDSEIKIHFMNIESLKAEINLLHELLKKDIQLQKRHYDALGWNKKGGQGQGAGPQEAATAAQEALPSESLEKNLNALNGLIIDIERENVNKGQLLENMDGLLKAMLRGSKKDIGTQVDEGELKWKASMVVRGSQGLGGYLGMLDSAAVNLERALNLEDIRYEDAQNNMQALQLLDMKAKRLEGVDLGASALLEGISKEGAKGGDKGGPTVGGGSNLAESWNLPVPVIVFLENITSQNYSARVLPWTYFKKIIYEIYNDRLNFSWEIAGSPLSSFVGMDEFICSYFLRTARLRRLAEMKLLEFLVSLKYYMKLWPRAVTFAGLCGITAGAKGELVFDNYTISFFLHGYSRLMANAGFLLEHSDGVTWLAKEKIEEVSKEVLPFLNDAAFKKFMQKVAKNIRFVTENAQGKDAAKPENEHIDVDKLLNLYLVEYVDARRRNLKALMVAFSKYYETDEGIFSLDDVATILAEVTQPAEGAVRGLSFPKEFTTLRTFLYALTSNKNSFELNSRDFMIACSRFGVDCPFPFINSGYNTTGDQLSAEDRAQLANKAAGGKTVGKKGPAAGKNVDQKQVMEESSPVRVQRNPGQSFTEKEAEAKRKSQSRLDNMNESGSQAGGGIKLDSTTMLFAQHFSILRELRSYCQQFKEVMMKESDMQTLWKSFDNIVSILDAGCQFLNFPIQM